MLFLQETQMVASMATDTLNAMAPMVEEPVKLNFFEMCLKGGWIMIPLALMLILAIYIFIERLIVTRQASKEDATFMNRVKDYIYEGKLDSALKLCRSTQSPSARMIEKGISRLGRPMSDVLVAIENVGNIEIAKLEKAWELEKDAIEGAYKALKAVDEAAAKEYLTQYTCAQAQKSWDWAHYMISKLGEARIMENCKVWNDCGEFNG